jgi:hypothetical protein
MKKGLLLSAMASAVLFAGGDIAPVEPVQPAPAATADFWGQIGARYEFYKDSARANDWGKADNTFSTAVVLGVNKDLGNGFGLGAEVAGWTTLGLDIAQNPAVCCSNGRKGEGELSQLYVTYTAGNTAIKAGRQAIPLSVSPGLWTDRTVGVADYTYNGIVIVNKDIPNTTLVAAWVASISGNDDSIKLSDDNDVKGAIMLGVINNSIANTTLKLVGYYTPKYDPAHAGGGFKNIWQIWGSAETKFNENVSAGLQLVGAGAKSNVTGAKFKKTFAAATYLKGVWGNFDTKLTLAYINKGQVSLIGAGTGLGSSGFWGLPFAYKNGGGDIDPSTNKGTQKIVRLEAGYKLPVGRIYGGISYDKFGSSSDRDKVIVGAIGYKFPIPGTNVKGHIQYRYAKEDFRNGTDRKQQRVRIEAYYKF